MIAFVVIGILLVLFVASLCFHGIALWLGLRWAKATNIALRRIAFYLLISNIGGVVGSLIVERPGVSFADSAICLTLFVFFSLLLIKKLFALSWLRSGQAWLPTLFASALVSLATLFLFRPFVLESFVCPTNSMAPTLAGQHWSGTCSVCGNPTFRSPDPHIAERRFNSRKLSFEQRMICDKNFHVTTTTEVPNAIANGDRFLVAKFLSPRRWDLVTFRKPDQPEVLYVKRLVGLPGEEITIRDGSVFANGEKLKPPPKLQPLHYKAKHDDMPMEAWGSVEQPAKLGDDEYFMLGDFPDASLDARFWTEGAVGHAPYAVPESHIEGVVAQTFWPLGRWQSFR